MRRRTEERSSRDVFCVCVPPQTNTTAQHEIHVPAARNFQINPDPKNRTSSSLKRKAPSPSNNNNTNTNSKQQTTQRAHAGHGCDSLCTNTWAGPARSCHDGKRTKNTEAAEAAKDKVRKRIYVWLLPHSQCRHNATQEPQAQTCASQVRG